MDIKVKKPQRGCTFKYLKAAILYRNVVRHNLDPVLAQVFFPGCHEAVRLPVQHLAAQFLHSSHVIRYSVCHLTGDDVERQSVKAQEAHECSEDEG